jgi:DNA-binding GntR family transcriptional regulator
MSTTQQAEERQNGSLAVSPIRAEAVSIAQLAYQTLRDAILDMDVYRPNADLRLDEQTLATALGVSRTPVRGALARLESEGLVQIVPRRGVWIVRKSKAEITEMIRAWAALESMAARLLCERATDEEIGSLRALFSTFEDDQLRLRLDEYSDANLRFHQKIIELARSPVISTLAAGLLVHVRAIRGHMIGAEDRAERSIVDHMHIIQALESRDAELAERLVRNHALALADDVDRTPDRWTETPGTGHNDPGAGAPKRGDRRDRHEHSGTSRGPRTRR